MSFSNSNTFRMSNENLLLINILNTMYNDNFRQINLLIETLNNLIENNVQVRNLLVQVINSNQNRYTNNNSANIFGRIMVNNRPYIIDSISEFTIPRNNLNRRNRSQTEDIFTQNFNNFLQPVEIYPTQSQIETATRHVRYCDIFRPVNSSCPISMDEFNDIDMVTVIRQCGHIFHTEYLMNWFRSNCRCPVCRHDIRDNNSNLSSELFNNQQASVDSSNNIPERNNTNNTNSSFSDDYMDNLNNFLSNNITGLVDLSGNLTSPSTDVLTSFLIGTLSRSRNMR
jgi:hypothetical protein